MATKTVDGVEYPASAWLVIEDPDMPSTWHLRYRDAQGNVDHRLLGACYASLTVGFRGQKYEGPDKAKALAELKRLYAAEEMAWPGEQAEEAAPAIIMGPIVMGSMTPEQAAQFEQRIKDVIREIVQPKTVEMEERRKAAIAMPEDELTSETLGESADGVELLSEGAVQDSGAGPLTLKVQIIEPGWGNAKDGHFYPADVVRRDAPKFKGAKMYETDHRPGEKSTRTWVSTLRDIIGYSETGAPIFDAVAHDPNFAQRMRNLAATKDADGQPMIRKMACSILASGTARKGQVDGKAGRIVEAITDVESVDWVTRAGAGGQALAIMSEAQGSADVPRTEPDTVIGGNDMVEDIKQEPAPTEEPVQEQAEPQPEPVVERLSEADVTAILAEAQANEAIKERLATGEYKDADALKTAIVAEVEYVKKATGAGKVTDMGEGAAAKPKTVTLAEVEEKVRQVNAKWGFGPKRQPEKVEAK